MSIPHRDLSTSSKTTKPKQIMHVPGSVVDNRYQIIQKLGRKDLGKTYLAKDLQATGDARCVVERLNPSYENEINWRSIERHFINEVAVLERLGDHPQIPQFYNYFIEDRGFYLVREYIDGDNLEQLVERKLFTEVDTIFLIQSVLRILDFIHKTNVIHRDVQPVHLIERKQDKSFVLLDFGAIREIEGTEMNLKGEIITGELLGNTAYIAPEQKMGQSCFQSDLYALGRSAVYALTGRSPDELESAHLDWQTQCQISPKLASILKKMMSPRISDRYASALDVLYDLKPLLKIKQVVGGRYEITNYLGGNNGVETYLADNLHRQYQSPCSIKQIELPHDRSGSKVKIERRFAEELSMLERLGYHQQIPQLWDHFEENDEFYLVQEYIQGENLAQKIKQQNLTVAEIFRIFASSLEVLGFIHQNRIVHRNLKPSNLIIPQGEREVTIIDFGILLDIKNPANLNSEGGDLGEDKLNYWSPEQIAGRATIGSDIYALGMCVIEALTRTKPSQIPRDKQTGKLLWAQELNLDRRLVKIIDRTIALDLGKRYHSVEDILRDLHRANILERTGNSGQRNRTQSKKSRRSLQPKIGAFITVGLLGIICLLGSVEFAFPTIRPLYHWYRGKRLLANQQPQAALVNFNKGIEFKPQNEIVWSGKGEALFSLSRYDEALKAYEEAAKLDRDNGQYWQKQGDILFKLERFTEAIALYDRALELEPNNGELYNYRGKALFNLQDYETALTMQNRALELDRLNPVFMSDRANNLIELGRYYEALTALNRVQISEPERIRLWQKKALVLEALNRPQEVATVEREIDRSYQQVLEKEPENAKIWLARGDFLMTRQMYGEAVESYRQAVELQPSFYRAWLALGEALTKTEQDKVALFALDKALEIRPQSYLAWYAKGLVHHQNRRDLTQAIDSYDRALAIDANYAPLWRDRGIALNQQGKYDRGIESLSKASELVERDARTWRALAAAWDEIGQDQKALLALDRAIELIPEDPQVWSQKGKIYTKNARYNEACDTYRQSLPVIRDSALIMTSMRSLGCRMN